MDYAYGVMVICDFINLIFAYKYDERIKYELFWMKSELSGWVKNLRLLWNCWVFIDEWLLRM